MSIHDRAPFPAYKTAIKNVLLAEIGDEEREHLKYEQKNLGWFISDYYFIVL